FVPQSKVVLIPNGVDTTLFRPSDVRPDRSEKVVVYVGRFAPQKNLFTLIDAVALIKQPMVKLLLVGDGELREQLEKHALERGISFEFRGIIPHEELPGVLNNADVFALPSLIEGHPKVLLEAMGCGLPCVGTNIQGIRDMIRDGETGLLCQSTADDLADKIAQVLSNRELADRLGREAWEFVKENLDLDRLLGEEIEIMRAVAIGKGR
ncbi:MAG: glycosyltransferase family 4 protein, partial [Deltaproteobacteria bacterium]